VRHPGRQHYKWECEKRLFTNHGKSRIILLINVKYCGIVSMTMWYTVKQVAQYLQLSNSTVYSMARKGILPASRIGNQWRFDKMAIDDRLKRDMPSIKREPAKGIK
jgi:excisionase family DNA binding protein